MNSHLPSSSMLPTSITPLDHNYLIPGDHLEESTSWLTIDTQAWHYNIQQYRQLLSKDVALGIVLKSNAYGHGLMQMGQLAQSNLLINWILVASVQEALHLRKGGVHKPILVLSILRGNLSEAIRTTIDLVIYDKESAHKVALAARLVNKKAYVHLKIDTGLSRLGTLFTAAHEFINYVQTLPNLIIRGIFTHLANSEQEDHSFVHLQQERLDNLIHTIKTPCTDSLLIHSACSAALGTAPFTHNNLVRLGLGAYGLWPSAENKYHMQQKYPTFDLKPVLTWKSTIAQLKIIPTGSFIGYDCTFQTTRPTRLAILPVGYWDGLDRRLSNKGMVIINHQCAPIVGRIAMNLIAVDVTDSVGVELNSIVTLLGDFPGITAHDHARLCETINYEIVTRINPELPRIVV